MDAIGHQRNLDGATKQIFIRQARIQAEVITTVTKMVQKQIVIISQIEFTRLRNLGVHRMDDGEYDKAVEIWDELVKREYRVMVFHEGLWRIGICLHETVGVEPRSYHVKIEDRTVESWKSRTDDRPCGVSRRQIEIDLLLVLGSQLILVCHYQLILVHQTQMVLVRRNQLESRWNLCWRTRYLR